MCFINWPFLQDVRVSETEPRIFYMEEFGFRTQFSLPLILNNNTSLAQCLQTGYLIAQVWHQSLKGNHMYYCSASYLHWLIIFSFRVRVNCCGTYLGNQPFFNFETRKLLQMVNQLLWWSVWLTESGTSERWRFSIIDKGDKMIVNNSVWKPQ